MESEAVEDWRRIESMYFRFRHQIWYLANRMLKDEKAAEDVVQMVVLRLWEFRKDLRKVPEEKHRVYCLKVAERVCIDILRRQELQARWEEIEKKAERTAWNPEYLTIEKEKVLRILTELSQLRISDSWLLHTVMAGAPSYAEMSSQMNISQNTLAVRLSRARRKLQNRLDENSE